jgi:hypothetical protein
MGATEACQILQLIIIKADMPKRTKKVIVDNILFLSGFKLNRRGKINGVNITLGKYTPNESPNVVAEAIRYIIFEVSR